MAKAKSFLFLEDQNLGIVSNGTLAEAQLLTCICKLHSFPAKADAPREEDCSVELHESNGCYRHHCCSISLVRLIQIS